MEIKTTPETIWDFLKYMFESLALIIMPGGLTKMIKQVEKGIRLSERKIRRLVNNERKFLWSPNANVTMVGRVRGDISKDALKKALVHIPVKHPLLASRVKQDEDRVLWFVHDPEIEIPLRTVDRVSEVQWIDEIIQEMSIPFDQFKGPLIRFVLVYSPHVSEIIAFSQHAICDGTAIAFLIRDVLNLMAKPDTPLQRVDPDFVLTDVFGHQDANWGIGQKIKSKIKLFSIDRINNKWRKNPVFFDHEDYLSIHNAYANKYQYGTVIMELDKFQTRNLTDVCREHGVTVNSALTTALVAAFQELYEGGNGQLKKIVIPLDLRRRMNPPMEDVFCLLVGSVESSFRYRSERSFWSNVHELHHKFVDKIEKGDFFDSALMMELIDPTLADVIVSFSLLARDVPPGDLKYEKMSAFANDSRNVANSMANRFLKSLPGIVNTNLGRLDFPETYGPLELETMYFAPAASINVPLIVGALGINGKLTATFNYLEPKDSSENIRQSEMTQISNLVQKHLVPDIMKDN